MTTPVPPAVASKSSISPKVILATMAALVAPGVLALLGYLQTDAGHTLLASLPPWAVVTILAVVPGLATFVAGYLKNDPLRVGVTPTLGEQPGPEDTYEAPADMPDEGTPTELLSTQR